MLGERGWQERQEATANVKDWDYLYISFNCSGCRYSLSTWKPDRQWQALWYWQWGSRVPPWASLPLPLLYGGEENSARCLLQLPFAANSGAIPLSGVNDILCFSQIEATACCHSDNDNIKIESITILFLKSLLSCFPVLNCSPEEGKMASQSYLAKCVFPSSVLHTGRAWEARCTAAAGAETENSTGG